MLKHSPEYYAEKYKNTFMHMAFAIAENSVAERGKIGCVIYLNNHTLSTGWNGRESGSDSEVCEYSDRDETRPDVTHAEDNAISKLPEGSELLKGAILFSTRQPCLGCSELIVDAGITRVYYKEAYRCNKGLRTLWDNGILAYQID